MSSSLDVAAPAASRRRSSTFDALVRYPSFRSLWLSNLLFGGVWTQTLVLGWLVFDLTGSVYLLALFTTARTGSDVVRSLRRGHRRSA
ncbi:MAG: hypothetical protein U0360_03785 [Dehalococcoidia bacterium]